MPCSYLTETLWIRDLDTEDSEDSGNDPYDGFFLAADGSLFFINIFSSTGDSWAYDGQKLILNSHTERYPDSTPAAYQPLQDEEELILISDGETGTGIRYRKETAWVTPESAHWLPVFLKGEGSIDIPAEEPEKEIYLRIKTTDNHAEGFGGVNGFGGSWRQEGITLESGPYMSTMMAGPWMQYESLFLRTLDEVDHILMIQEELYLYKGTEGVIKLKAQFY